MPHDSNQPPELDPQPHYLDPRLKRALAHRPRLEIFGYLARKNDEKGTGEQELAEIFGMHIRLAEYHLKVLHDADLIAHVDDRQEKGTAERFYVATASL